MTYFQENPFATNVIVPFQVVASTSQKFGPFDCSQFQGARYSIGAAQGAQPCVANLWWYDDSSLINLATPSVNAVGYRQVVIGNGIPSTFTLPHLGDWLVIDLEQAGALGAYSTTIAVAQRQNPAAQFGIWQPIFFGPVVTAGIANGATVTINGSGVGGNQAAIYAGPALLHVHSTSSAGFGSDVFVEALNSAGTYDEFYRRTVAADIDEIILVPSAGLRVRITNLTGAAGIIYNVSLVADQWRVG